MTRTEFIKMCGLLGIGMPILGACKSTWNTPSTKPIGKVAIIGAGAAGLTAAYLLTQQGIEVEVLEAHSNYGGRMKRNLGFADFPISLGAEWLHVKRGIFEEIVNDETIEISTLTQPYNYDVDKALIDGQEESLKALGFTIDQKFIGSSWFDFFEQYVVPSVKDKVRLKTVVTAIDYSSDQIRISTDNDKVIADKVIVTVPVKLLQQNTIAFTPALPEDKAEAIQNVLVWGGFKAFIEFSEKFYPTAIATEASSSRDGHTLFYDAAYGQNSNHHIMGMIAVGPISEPYLEKDEEARIAFILDELDQVFGGKARSAYVKHMFQNWNEEPFAQGAYVHYYEKFRTFRALSKPISDKLFFAGDAYTDGSDWSSVHAAARAAIRTIEELIG